MNLAALIVVLIPTLLILLLVPILIGIYVYRDARRRRMNAVVWTLVAVLAPTFIGFIIYLLVRSGYADLVCPRCGAAVTAEYVVCPQCGATLRAACPSCRTPVEPDWKVCPRCAAPLPEEARQAAAPVRRKDKALWKLLIAIILIPLLLFGLAVLALTTLSGSGSMSFRPVTREEVETLVTPDQLEQIQYAVRSAELEENTACALRYTRESESGNTYYFLLYVPGGSDSPHTSFGQRSTLFGTTIEIELYRTSRSGDFYAISSSAEHPPRLRLTVGDRKYDCQVWDVDFNPTPYVIEPPIRDIDQMGNS